MDARPRMIIAGASGLIGRALVAELKDEWRITVLTREVRGDEPEGTTAVAWNPSAAADGDVAHVEGISRLLEGADVLINLAGAPIAEGRFDDAHKRRILDSRVHATTTLVEAAARCELAPRTWIQASGSGAYGDRGEEDLDERSPLGDDFMAEVARAWEAAAAPAAERSRLVIARIGIVLDREATAWKRLVLPVRLFVGGPIAGGRMWWPWIHSADLIRALIWAIRTPEVDVQGADGSASDGNAVDGSASAGTAAAGTAVDGDTRTEAVAGPYVLCAPEPARQIDLTRAAARVLRRPSLVPVPAFALRILFGGMPDHLLLPSTKARPRKLLRQGFAFRYPDADAAARDLLSG